MTLHCRHPIRCLICCQHAAGVGHQHNRRRFSEPSGASNALLRLMEMRRATLLCSTALFLEYEAVLSRAETRAVTGHQLDDIARIMRALAALSEPVDISFRLRPILRDADDEMVLETALNGHADAIVTHNVKDFGPARSLNGVEITTPGNIVRRLKND